MPAGQDLKTIRNRRNVTVREVEQASRRIADVKGDKRFCISNAWLTQLENGASEPSIFKLFSLSVIYRTNFLDLLGLYNVGVEEKETYQSIANPDLTQLISENGNGHCVCKTPAPQEYLSPCLKPMSAKQLVGAEDCGPHIIYAHLGLTDFTMYPMIRPGALLKIDTSQNKLPAIAWQTQYDRPVYFIELRGGYACGWCELHGNQLLIIPFPASPAAVHQFTYPREAEILGRVVGYSTTCIDGEAETNSHKR